MKKDRIILISGKQGSGKSTLVQGLCEYFGKGNAYIFKFADPLYAIHDMVLPFAKSLGIRPENMKKDGELLQVLGTEWGRKISPDTWAKVLRKRVDDFRFTTQHAWILIDDARFENEFDIFPDAFRVRLIATESTRKARCSYWRLDTEHPSETSLDSYAAQGKFDVEIYTESTKENARESLLGALQMYQEFSNGL